MAGRLQGKVALVTGGSAGIGRATALAMAREGAQVIIANRGVAGGEETVWLITTAGGAATFLQTDVLQTTQGKHSLLVLLRPTAGWTVFVTALATRAYASPQPKSPRRTGGRASVPTSQAPGCV